MRIGAREIGDNAPGALPYIIAEIGVNHDGAPERALDLVDAAADAGADAVKVQVFDTDLLMSRGAKLAAYQAGAGETDPVEMLRRLQLSPDALADVCDRAHHHGLGAIATVFSVDLVGPSAELPWDAFKSASPDIINRPLLDAMASTGRPLIVSTGASERAEVERTRAWLDAIADRLAFLQCVSAYPTPPELASLSPMLDLVGIVAPCPVGYSDHTPETDTGRRAVALGASILEKHLTYDRGAQGPDHAASLDTAQFAEYVRLASDASMHPDTDPPFAPKELLDCERDVRAVSRQSLTTTRALGAGHTLTRGDLTIKRPGTGVAPFLLGEVIGRALGRDVAGDTPLHAEDLA